jgi:hypothetical protein
MRLLAVLSSSLLLLGCDDVPFGPAAAPAGPNTPIPTSPTACDIAAHVTEVHCTGCHGGSTEPLLTLEGLKATVGAASIRYTGTLVVAGDAEGSLLFRKLHGPAENEGAQMPIGQVLDVELQEAVRRWIDDGAVTDCEPVEGGGGGGGGGIAPGGPIDVGAPPRDFATEPPSFAAGTSCSTNQWWQHAGDEEESFSMHPGRACIDCHTNSGDSDAPRFAFAGTVMGDLRDEDDCRGVPGVTVDLLDASDRVVGSALTNAAGNFGLCGPDGPGDNAIACASVPLTSPWRVRLSYEGRTREMLGHQDAVGDCMGCHTAAGRNGAPGRVVAP